MREDFEAGGFDLNGWSASIVYNINQHLALQADKDKKPRKPEVEP